MAIVTIQIYVSDVENVLLNFDKIQVQRSKLGDPYTDAELITDAAATYPVMDGTVSSPFPALNGEDLVLKVNGGVEQTLVFASANPVSITNVISEINGGLTNLTASDNGSGQLRLTGTLAGTAGTIEIVSGAALADLGLSQDIAHGKDPHIGIQSGVSTYSFSDLSGAASYWYRTRYYNLTNGTFGGWSDWLQGSTGTTLASGSLIIGKAKLANIDGVAISGAKITLVNVFSPLISDSYFISGRSKQIETDITGLAETTLVKGSILDLILEGTSIVRRIQVPSTGSEFDLLDSSLVLDDMFGIQVPDLPAAVRRS